MFLFHTLIHDEHDLLCVGDVLCLLIDDAGLQPYCRGTQRYCIPDKRKDFFSLHKYIDDIDLFIDIILFPVITSRQGAFRA